MMSIAKIDLLHLYLYVLICYIITNRTKRSKSRCVMESIYKVLKLINNPKLKTK